jgi:hypothetical protein
MMSRQTNNFSDAVEIGFIASLFCQPGTAHVSYGLSRGL